MPSNIAEDRRRQMLSMPLCQKIILLDAHGQLAMDADLADALAQLIRSIPKIVDLVAAVRILEHQGVLALSASGHDDVEAAKRQAREAAAALNDIA